MRMRMLRTVDRINRVLHPAQCIPRVRKILRECISRVLPLRALIARSRGAQRAPRTCRYIDNLQSFVRMVGVAKDPRTGAIRSDMPRVVLHDQADFARRPIHPAECPRPNGEHQVARASEECFVYEELIVPVLVQALESATVAPDPVHPRSRIARKLDPLRLERMELRMNHGARERNRRG